MRGLSKSLQARSILVGASCVFGLSLAAWVIWGTYAGVANSPHASHPEIIIGAVIAQLVALGIMSLVFGLMPFRFMDGYSLRTWNLPAWIGIYAVAAFWFALVLIRNNSNLLQKHHPPDAIAKPFVLFLVFGVLSGLFWLYFRLRPEPQAQPAEPQAQAPEPQASEGSTPPVNVSSSFTSKAEEPPVATAQQDPTPVSPGGQADAQASTAETNDAA
jgi:hypothetical protein